MERSGKIIIAGCGPGSADLLTDAARTAVSEAEVLIGAQRLLDLFPETNAHRIVVDTKIDILLDSIEQVRGKRVVVLVSGDPGLFSLGKLVVRKFGRENCTVIPGISSVQAAFAALGYDWADAKIISAHKEDPVLSGELLDAGKIAILAGREESLPWVYDRLAPLLNDAKIFVCEDISLEDEKIREVPRELLKEIEVSSRTIVIIIKSSCL